MLGNLDAKIDFGYAKEYMEVAWKIMQLEHPDDFIICTEELHSVREFVEEAFVCIGIELAWKGEGLNEIGYDLKTGTEYVGFDPKFFRPSKTAPLQGDSSKAKRTFTFHPKIHFKELVKRMVENDFKEIEKGKVQ